MRNLMLSTTEAQIEEAFSAHVAVEQVRKIRDYAFVHFHTKEDARSAKETMNGEVDSGASVVMLVGLLLRFSIIMPQYK